MTAGLPGAAVGKAAESDFAVAPSVHATGKPLAHPIEVSFKFRFPTVAAAQRGLDLLGHDVRRLLRNKSAPATLDRGVPRAILRFTAVLPPPDLLGIAKSVISPAATSSAWSSAATNMATGCTNRSPG